MKSWIKAVLIIGLFILFIPLSKAKCIGVVMAGGGHEFWHSIEKGARKASEELNIDIFVRGAINETNSKGQRSIIKFMERMGCLGLVIAPNSISLRDDVAHLKQKGIPTVYIDRDIGGERVSVVKTDNYTAGINAGKEMVKALKGSGNVAVFRMDKAVIPTTLRENGFIKAATDGGLNVVLEAQLGGAVRNARENALDIIKNLRNINGIFTPNESTTLSVLSGLQYYNLEKKIIHIDFDIHHLILKSLHEKNMYGTFAQHPFEMGYQSVHAVFKTINGNSVDKEIDTGSVFININNINDQKFERLLSLEKNGIK